MWRKRPNLLNISASFSTVNVGDFTSGMRSRNPFKSPYHSDRLPTEGTSLLVIVSSPQLSD